jgi:hypothetical protein
MVGRFINNLELKTKLPILFLKKVQSYKSIILSSFVSNIILRYFLLTLPTKVYPNLPFLQELQAPSNAIKKVSPDSVNELNCNGVPLSQHAYMLVYKQYD